MEHVTRLQLKASWATLNPYPTVLLPNLTHLNLFTRYSNEFFTHFANILPGMNPTHVSLDIEPPNDDEEDERRYTTFSTYIKSWTRLRTIILVGHRNFLVQLDGTRAPRRSMDAVLFDSVALLEGKPVVERLKFKIVFDCRDMMTCDSDDPLERSQA